MGIFRKRTPAGAKTKGRRSAAFSMVGVMVIAMLATGPMMAAGGHGGKKNPCLDETTLEALVACLKDRLPRRGTEGYEAPTTKEFNAWKKIGTTLQDGRCGWRTVPGAIHDEYHLARFTDQSSGRTYCVLAERPGAEVGWGTVILDPLAESNFIIQAPHPLFDSGTPEWGIGLFAGTDARTFMMAGTRRYANADHSSDVAHNPDSPFHAFFLGILSLDRPGLDVLQVHGMGTSTCEGTDAHIANGEYGIPHEHAAVRILEDTAEIRHRDWTVTVTDDEPYCNLNARTNSQARAMIDQPHAACGDVVCLDRFMHIEAHWDFRSAEAWNPAVSAYRLLRP